MARPNDTAPRTRVGHYAAWNVVATKPCQAASRVAWQAHVSKGPNTPLPGSSFEMMTAMSLSGATEAGWKIVSKDGSYTLIAYDAAKQEVFVDRSHSGDTSFSKDFPARTAAPFAQSNEKFPFDILVDRNSMEVFVGDGRVALTNLIFPKTRPVRMEFYSKGTKAAKLFGSDVWALKSIW